MKKILSIAISVLMLVSLFALTGCGAPKTLKFGAAVYVSAPSATDATADKQGEGKVDVTVAAVTVDEAGKIVACDLDTMQSTVKYTTEGKAVGNAEAKTKYEQGAGYNMVAYGGAKKEWFEQAAALDDKLLAAWTGHPHLRVIDNSADFETKLLEKAKYMLENRQEICTQIEKAQDELWAIMQENMKCLTV